MSYLTGFSADIFVSYSHIDDHPFGENETRWVTEFHRNLEIRVRNYLGRPITIWRDPKLTGADVFSDEIAARIKRTGVLVSIVSPGYIQSDWCKRELELFAEGVRETGDLQVANQQRIVKVLKTPVPRNSLPKILDSVLGYEFYRVEWGSEVVREFLLDPNPEARRAYWARIDDVAQAIKTLFEGIKERKPAAPSDSTAVIYLAAVSSDIQGQRDALYRDLVDRGYSILPDHPSPWNAEQLIAAVRLDLARCVMSIHMFGARYGLVPEGDRRSIVELENDLAAERAGTGFLRVLWIPAGLDQVEDRQLEFLERVRAPADSAANFELLETTLEDLKTFVLARLSKLAAPDTPAGASRGRQADSETDVRLYFVCEPRDRQAIAPLRKHFTDAGFEVVLSLAQGEPEQVREDHQENLLLADGVLVYWGVADEFWIRSKMRDLLRVRGLGRTNPFRSTAIYIADPARPEKEEFDTRQMRVIRQSGSFSPETLRAVVSDLSEAPNASE